MKMTPEEKIQQQFKMLLAMLLMAIPNNYRILSVSDAIRAVNDLEKAFKEDES